jgi:outer membrane protein assembly factor BamB
MELPTLVPKTNTLCLNARDGVLLWKYLTHDRVSSSPAVVDGKVYTGADDGFVYCLNAVTGDRVWAAYAGGEQQGNFNAAVQLRSSPTVVDNRVYVGSLDNSTYCLNASDGSTVRQYQTKGYITSTPAGVAGAVYVVAQEPLSGALYKLNAADGS